ncbi:MAG: AAA family ATPase [Myxococcota bacterium]
MSRSQEPQAELVYGAADVFVERALQKGTSLFADGREIWTDAVIEKTITRLVDNEIFGDLDYMSKLHKQLDGAPDDVILLTAETIYFYVLIARKESLSGGRKREMIQSILSWMENSVPIPDKLDKALEDGLTLTGMGFHTNRYWLVKYLLLFARAWWATEPSTRDVALSDPWAFRDFAFGIDVKASRTQRHALIHLVHPETFEAIVSYNQKRQIADAFSDLVEDGENVDRELAEIRDTIEREHGRFGSFYDKKMRWRWDPDASRWSEYVRWAKKLADLPDFDENEREYKLEAAAKFAAARGAVRNNSSEWLEKTLDAVKEVTGNPIYAGNGAAFQRWLNDHSDDARALLASVWKQADEPLDALEAFLEKLPESVVSGANSRITLGSVFLWGFSPDSWPYYQYTPFQESYELSGVPTQPESDDTVAIYEHALDFLDELRTAISDSDSTLDRLDAQSVVWMFHSMEPEQLLSAWDSETVEHFAKFVGKPLPKDENTAAWLMQANPSKWDLREFLQDAELGTVQTWLVTRYWHEIQKGDRLLLWSSGQQGGLYAIGRVTREPYATDETFQGDEGFELEWELERKVEPPLLRKDIADDDILSESQIIRAPQGTNFRVTEREWERFMELRPEVQEPDSYTIDHALDDLFIDREEFVTALELLRERKNIILQGPPGVGKTFMADRLAYALMQARDRSRIELVQFHQSFTYEDFIQGYRPAEDGGFERKNGVFWRFCARAREQKNRDFVFVIDEINRGNLSKIFGELMLLLEADKRARKYAVSLQYARPKEEKFFIPPNVHLIGTMNTADRSLAVVDYALRRRFAFIDVAPGFNSRFEDFALSHGVKAQVVNKVRTRLSQLNREIAEDHQLGAGFKIGHSYFCPNGEGSYGEDWFHRAIRYQVGPLLKEYWFDQPERAERAIERLLEGYSR